MSADTVFLLAAYVFLVCGGLGLAASLAEIVRPDWANKIFTLNKEK